MSDVPIDPQDYVCGVSVVQIEDLRIARGLSRRARSACKHKSMVYDTHERRVWCTDCESSVETFDALMALTEYFHRAEVSIERRQKELKELETFQLRSRAAKKIDKYWRKHDSVPCCPHCNAALMPEDVMGPLCTTSKEFELKRRAKKSV